MQNTPIHPEKSKAWEWFKEICFWTTIVPLAIFAALLDVIIEIGPWLLALAVLSTIAYAFLFL